MHKTKSLIGRRYDGTFGKIGTLLLPVPVQPQEPTPQTLQWLTTLAQARATGQTMLVGQMGALWIEIIGLGEMLGTYTIRQLPTGIPPAFYSPLTQQKNYYTTEIHAAILRAELSSLFLFDPRE